MSENNLWSVAFPTLDEEQINLLARCSNAAPKLYRDGQALFEVGDRNLSCFIVKSGDIEIVDYSGDEPKALVVHHKGQFTGDISLVDRRLRPSLAASHEETVRCTSSPGTPCAAS